VIPLAITISINSLSTATVYAASNITSSVAIGSAITLLTIIFIARAHACAGKNNLARACTLARAGARIRSGYTSSHGDGCAAIGGYAAYYCNSACATNISQASSAPRVSTLS
jgi:hypothetical protein